MSIEIKFFASLKETLSIDNQRIELQGLKTAEDVWSIVTKDQPLPSNLLCAVNHQHVRLDHVVSDGDEIAFFPPVTGG